MIQIPLTISFSLVTFIAVALVLLLIFGSPKCDDLANSTAYYLKTAIDGVSNEAFPTWDNQDEPPANDDITYYRTAPIALCQDKGITYWETILGTTMEPQYQIYYERFPESGGGIWTEAYPWSGGAASSLRMWAFMRVGTGALKVASNWPNIITIMKFGKDAAAKGVKVAGQNIAKKNFEKVVEQAGELVGQPAGAIGRATISGKLLLSGFKKGEGEEIIEQAFNMGWLRKLKDNFGRIVMRNEELTATFDSVKIVNGEEIVESIPIFAKKNPMGEIVELSATSGDGFKPLTINTKEVYNNWLETLPEATRTKMKAIYIFEDDANIGPLQSLVGKMKETNFYKSYLGPIERKLSKTMDTYEYAGYNVRNLALTSNGQEGIKLGTVNAIASNEKVAKAMLNQDSVKNKILRFFGKSSGDIKSSELTSFIKNAKFNGMAIVDKGSQIDAISPLIKEVEDTAQATQPIVAQEIVERAYGTRIVGGIATVPVDAVDLERFKVLQDYAKRNAITVDAAANKMLNEMNSNIMPHVASGIEDSSGLWDRYTSKYLSDLVDRMESSDELIREQAASDFGSYLGLIEQNKNYLPTKIVRSRTGTAVDYFKAEAKKIIYLDGPQNLLNPSSFYSKGLFASQMTESCEGNSICVYSYNAMTEHPIYLNESATEFAGNIRSWRPVAEWQRWAMWQAALQHVPAHPRFYVNSPCLANAKVWKTELYGVPTIFVYPQKVDLEGNTSNYCYADSDLVNQYVATWMISDIATLASTIISLGGPSGALKLVDQISDVADPITLTQGLVEGAISWPGWPFKSLTWETIAANRNKIGIIEIKTGSKE